MARTRVTYEEVTVAMHNYKEYNAELENYLNLLNGSMQRVFTDSEGNAIEAFETEYSIFCEKYKDLMSMLEWFSESLDSMMKTFREIDEENAKIVSDIRRVY